MTELPQFAPVEPWMMTSLREHVHDIMRKAIISGRLKSGEKLNERRLALELGISTTPLKEALRQLETEGLVRTEPRRGVYATFDAQQAEEMTLARAALESMIARQAAKHFQQEHIVSMESALSRMDKALHAEDVPELIVLNEEFHDAIHEASGCRYLRRLQNNQRMYNHQTRLSVLAESEERQQAFMQHAEIFEAICQRDQELAEKRMREHVMLAGEKYIRMVFGPRDGGSK